ncbi:flagellar basal-body rod protein FlgB [Marinitoga sp. 1135]|uniref:Flagellar basal body rod protein FlgB n=1 Tax=Marinitoga piezophila (strain DSM 14283 / JCM 11233 / KA3) TaxID=443254 RepID=H2J4Q3_MARPK|nr:MULTISPECIES: flagellar basal body rod protein FlgB [Marinitoga]AEX85995.1 flagellar basal-body rod protein FlgB [Marinitoga piezophila KA3]APT76417.1 flagellar basal-body rod protein FlgB [Marinitoga sp. 1137]NUU96185.1 flagellar basal-body rod protein FlgB [Marinitoga sp. 1135]NUU98093.1 flagellar basal-body rod protein FlgB [Marinitoga sp. 1138]
MFVKDLALNIIPKSLDAVSVRQRVYSHNIANYNTPGYKRKDVSFEEELRKALGDSNEIKLKTTNQKHLKNIPDLNEVSYNIIEDKSRSNREDGNNVDIDVEMVKMMENTLQYNALTRLINYRFNDYKTVIGGIR